MNILSSGLTLDLETTQMFGDEGFKIINLVSVKDSPHLLVFNGQCVDISILVKNLKIKVVLLYGDTWDLENLSEKIRGFKRLGVDKIIIFSSKDLNMYRLPNVDMILPVYYTRNEMDLMLDVITKNPGLTLSMFGTNLFR